jgi:hypothetical protein
MGTLFSSLHALAHFPQPIHLLISMPIPYHFPFPLGGSEANKKLSKGVKAEATATPPTMMVPALKKFLLDIFDLGSVMAGEDYGNQYKLFFRYFAYPQDYASLFLPA